MDSFERLWYDKLNGWQAGTLPADIMRPLGRLLHMAGRKNRYGYQEYRGRSGGRVVLIFIIVLLAVLLAGGIAFMVFMGDYIKYTDTGMEIDWPWLNDGVTAPPEVSDPVVVETDDVVVTVEPTEEPTPTPPPEPQYDPLAVVSVTAAQLREGAAAQAAANAGCNALLVEMKAATGKLSWIAQEELAGTLYANAPDNTLADAVRALAETGDLYLVARVHCFRDPIMSNAGIGSLMSQRGRIWYDFYGVPWTSPANQQAVDYLSALCLELADMGFDEILLDDAGYPTEGEVNALATSENRPEDRTVPVAAFYSRLAGELKEKGVCLSVYANEKLLPGEEVYSGITAAVLAQNAGRVWLDSRVDREHYQTILTTSGLDNPAARIVAPADAAGEGSWYR